ncbi:hypothetical protein [Nocardia brasiliensis]|uniref:hypothetical protein n=1 Tax=Nocardia brasiliensis TaxID=37326 RepID=UPI0011DD1E22|nr:hypothetical protein [Nocardia brasiliensis]
MKRSPRVAVLSLITAVVAGPVLAPTLSMGTAQAIELDLETNIGLNANANVDGSANVNAQIDIDGLAGYVAELSIVP